MLPGLGAVEDPGSRVVNWSRSRALWGLLIRGSRGSSCIYCVVVEVVVLFSS